MGESRTGINNIFDNNHIFTLEERQIGTTRNLNIAGRFSTLIG